MDRMYVPLLRDRASRRHQRLGHYLSAVQAMLAIVRVLGPKQVFFHLFKIQQIQKFIELHRSIPGGRWLKSAAV